MGKLIPLLLALAGLGAGVGAGLALRPDPAPEQAANPCGEVASAEGASGEHGGGRSAAPPAAGEETTEFVKLNNQFVVPVVEDGRVSSLVVMSLGVELDLGKGPLLYQREPKLRDAFLQVLFDHANAGGFSGQFTDAAKMRALRQGLNEAAASVLGPIVHKVLLTEIVRQDV